MKVTALVITFNEEARIERCINSLKNVSDEIIVVDSYSTDKTPEICKRLNVRLIFNRYTGQIEQKNFALSHATHDYILSIDADEELTNELSNSIAYEKANGFTHDGYLLNRLNNYAGQWIRHGGWYPEWKMRLWNKHKATWVGKNPHDQVVLHHNVTSKKLKGQLLHFAFDSVAEHRLRINQYATIGAKSLIASGKKASILHLLLSPTVKFVRDFVFKLGFLDGILGWKIACLSAKSKYLKYRKSLDMQNQAQ